VGPEFSDKLSHLNSADKQVKREVSSKTPMIILSGEFHGMYRVFNKTFFLLQLKAFILTTTTNSSEINLGGYVRIDRGFLVRVSDSRASTALIS
jgi:hypothetical protein